MKRSGAISAPGARAFSCLGPCLLAAAFVSPALAVSPSQGFTGTIVGVVTDLAGAPQAGASVLLYDRFEKLRRRLLTDDRGSFRFGDLAAGVYSVRVSLASFMPAIRDGILVQAGSNHLLTITLASVFSNIELSYSGAGPPPLMSEEWKWVLRTGNATRPVLRLLPDITAPTASHASRQVFSGTSGMLKVSAGDGALVSNFGSESDLGTAFALATSLFGKNQVQLSGNFGFASQSGLPSAGFRTSFSRANGLFGDGLHPEVSLTMRQLFVPGRTAGGLVSSAVGLPALRTLSLSMDDGLALGDQVRLDYGFSLDSVSFFDRLNYVSPYAKLSYSLAPSATLEVAYHSGVPRSDVMTGETLNAPLQSELNALAMFPRVSLRQGRATVQRSDNLEIGLRKTAGSRTYRVAIFRENVRNAGLSASGAGAFLASGDVLPDLFTNASVFNVGGYTSAGYLASVTQKAGDHLELTVMYGSGGALVADRETGTTGTAEELRSMIRQGRRQSVTAQLSATLPRARTLVVGGYQWADRRVATPPHFYVTQRVRTEPGLNISVRQPVPTGPLFPVQMEVTADLRNLLEQGYLPFQFSNGNQVVLMNTPRSVRGGLSFIF
jgi:hypothetical protein